MLNQISEQIDQEQGVELTALPDRTVIEQNQSPNDDAGQTSQLVEKSSNTHPTRYHTLSDSNLDTELEVESLDSPRNGDDDPEDHEQGLSTSKTVNGDKEYTASASDSLEDLALHDAEPDHVPLASSDDISIIEVRDFSR